MSQTGSRMSSARTMKRLTKMRISCGYLKQQFDGGIPLTSGSTDALPAVAMTSSTLVVVVDESPSESSRRCLEPPSCWCSSWSAVAKALMQNTHKYMKLIFEAKGFEKNFLFNIRAPFAEFRFVVFRFSLDSQLSLCVVFSHLFAQRKGRYSSKCLIDAKKTYDDVSST